MANIQPSVGLWSSTEASNQPDAADAATVAADLRALQAGVKAALEPLSSVAGTNTITATCAGLTAYFTGEVHSFIPANANTGATTINITSLGAKNIFRNGLALVAGELKKNQPVVIQYDGTQFNIVSTGANLVQRDIAGYISGLTYANNVADATNDLDISAGVAIDGSGVYLMRGSAITKQLDAAWAVGTNAGGLDTGSIGNSDYYIWLIARSDTGVVDVLFSLSSTAPTMPANYDFKRLIGWFKRVGGAIVLFHTYETEGGGIELAWDVPTLDVSLANTLTTSRRTDAVKVPLNFSTIANLNVAAFDASSGFQAWVTCPDVTDAAPAALVAPLGTVNPPAGSAGLAKVSVRTSATGTIASRATLATVDTYSVVTLGFNWARR